MQKIRKPAVQGKFYPAQKEEIDDILEMALYRENPDSKKFSESKIIGGIVPHAGYIFSAYQAVHFFQILKNSKQIFDTILIINPNHTGLGVNMAIDNHTAWKTPYGEVEIDLEFAHNLQLPFDSEAHKYEHSGEVILPMLQYFLNYPFKIVPICMLHQTTENARLLAEKIITAKEKSNKNILLIASSDFSHFLSPQKSKTLDDLVVENILQLNEKGVTDVVKKNNISVCGHGAISTLLYYSKLCSKNPKIEMLKRGHSGLVMPSNEVVNYISFLSFE